MQNLKASYAYTKTSWKIRICCCTDVYLRLNGHYIPNHGYLMVSDIGSTEGTALLCHTNRPASGGNSGGDWFAPDGDKVGSVGSTTVPGFGRNRAPMIVRLRRNAGTPEEGIYHCEVGDATMTTQTAHVGLYNIGEGIYTCIIQCKYNYKAHTLYRKYYYVRSNAIQSGL